MNNEIATNVVLKAKVIAVLTQQHKSEEDQ